MVVGGHCSPPVSQHCASLILQLGETTGGFTVRPTAFIQLFCLDQLATCNVKVFINLILVMLMAAYTLHPLSEFKNY